MIDPKLVYCQCGWTFKPTKFQKIRMLLHEEIKVTCPQCQSRLTLRLIYHVVKVKTDVVDKTEVYKNG